MTVIARDGRHIAADSLMLYGTERAAQPAGRCRSIWRRMRK